MSIKIHQNIINELYPNYKLLSRFSGGLSNYTYLALDTITNKEVVIRFKGENGELFVDYVNEEKNLKHISKLEITSNTICTIPKIGLKISSYIQGSSPSCDSSINYLKVSTILKQLHNSNIKFTSDFSPLTRLDQYEHYHNNFNNSYYELKQAFLNYYNLYLIDKHLVACHNDAQLANFIISNHDKYFLLDWEFAGNNDPLYDIASFGNKDFNCALKLLATYYPNYTSNQLRDLYIWRMFQCLLWFNVANTKHNNGLSTSLHVDFDIIATNYLVLARKFNTTIMNMI